MQIHRGVSGDQKWVSPGQELLESYAWRAASGPARKALDRILVEHLHHGSLENGDLPVTYNDFVAYSLRRNSLRPGLEEAVALGLIDIIEPGVRAWGPLKKGTCPLPAHLVRHSRWCVSFQSLETVRQHESSMKDAKAAVEAARDAINSSRSGLK